MVETLETLEEPYEFCREGIFRQHPSVGLEYRFCVGLQGELSCARGQCRRMNIFAYLKTRPS